MPACDLVPAQLHWMALHNDIKQSKSQCYAKFLWHDVTTNSLLIGLMSFSYLHFVHLHSMRPEGTRNVVSWSSAHSCLCKTAWAQTAHKYTILCYVQLLLAAWWVHPSLLVSLLFFSFFFFFACLLKMMQQTR
jgi:hypothetical protein